MVSFNISLYSQGFHVVGLNAVVGMYENVMYVINPQFILNLHEFNVFPLRYINEIVRQARLFDQLN